MNEAWLSRLRSAPGGIIACAAPSGGEPPQRPTARGAAGVEEPVVEPARSTLPELNAAWNHAIPAPVLGQGHDPRAEASGKLLLAPLQLVARGDFRALLRDPGPDLCRPRAGL